jgi:hypothetical protein
LRQDFPRLAGGFLMINGQLLAGQTENALRSPSINFALAKNNPVAAFFKRNFAVLHPLFNVRGREVQIIGDPVKVKQSEWHKMRALYRALI